MLEKPNVKKLALIVSLVIVIVYAGVPRILSASRGLPYHHFWDEPQSVSGALTAMKRNRIFSQSGIDYVYGGALRNPMIMIDYFYFQYLKLSPKYEVEDKSDIINYLDGPFKTTSHSGFYYWSRIYVILINTLAFVFLFEIGRLRGGYAFGFISVIILGSIWRYYQTSYLGNVDVPLSTWTLGTILFALKFNRFKNKRNLYYSLICVGLAGATKYTGALTCIIPLTSAFLNRSLFEWSSGKDIFKSLFKWGGISFGVFVLLNPIVVVFPDKFYKVLKWLSMTYKTGQGHLEKKPGLEHLSYQLGELVKNFGSFFIYLSLAGLIFGILRLFYKKYWKDDSNSSFVIIAFFPVFYLLYFTFFYTIAYHRNFTLLYPILAIFSTEAIIWAFGFAPNNIAKIKNLGFLFNLSAIALFFYLSYPGYSNILRLGKNAYNSIETRTSSILEINELSKTNPDIFLGISNDLLISPEDLRKLDVNYGFFKIDILDSAILGFTHLIIPDYELNEQIENFDSLRIPINKYVQEHEITRVPGNKLAIRKNLNEYSRPILNPSVIILKGEDYPPPLMKSFKLPLEFVKNTVLPSNSPVQIFSKVLEPGSYTIRFECRGSEANSEYPIFKILLESDTIATYVAPETFELNEIGFNISSKLRYHIYFKMENDLYDAQKGLDRNVFLKNLQLRKLEN